MITSTTDKERSFVPFKNDGTDRVALVNSLEGLGELELGGVVAEVQRALNKSGIKVTRLLSGSFMVSTCPDFQSSCFCSPSQTRRELPSMISSCLYLMIVPTPQVGSGPPGSSQSRHLRPPFLPQPTEKPGQLHRAHPPSRTLVDPLNAFVAARGV
ncbi:hypothetical protein AZE42_00219 [Rhizopogon vesiculosus]|uniref:DhaK domain-containing protein n=1 Tax=Rhizopogon vesiculosus TaxID=180088 RepID=A0A1J8Q825_9AGAM|nr:hypothetical protein AZE42_00219 [Rhizopogon vesiculosus]